MVVLLVTVLDRMCCGLQQPLHQAVHRAIREQKDDSSNSRQPEVRHNNEVLINTAHTPLFGN